MKLLIFIPMPPCVHPHGWLCLQVIYQQKAGFAGFIKEIGEIGDGGGHTSQNETNLNFNEISLSDKMLH